jgi:Ca-activated chloride channel family protein
MWKKVLVPAATSVLFSTLLWPSFLQGQFVIRMDMALVSLDVAVSDSDGRPVTNLTRDDFLIFEDGQPQNLHTFESTDSPYDLVLLFDCSESTVREWPLLNEATEGFSKQRKPQDRTLIAAFGSRVQIIRNWNSRRQNKLDRDWICSGTKFYEALNWAIQRMNGVKGRKGVVMLTDGVDSQIPTRMVAIDGRRAIKFEDSTTDREFQKALRLVGKRGIPFYFVAVGTDLNPSFEIPAETPDFEMANMRQARSRMEQLAEASGGGIVFPIKPEDVIPMYEQIGRELGTSYTLGYVAPNPKPDGKRHRIEVRLKAQNLKLKQSRDTYTAK